MSDKTGGELVALQGARERVVATLTHHFSHDRLDLTEFERRVDLANRALTVAEIDGLVADLPGTTALAPAQPAAPLVPARERQTVLAVLGGTERRGSWACPRVLRVYAMLGGVELDFREVQLQPGVTEIHAYTLFGGVHVVVPPELYVATDGIAIAGGFDHSSRGAEGRDPNAPMLLIRGVAVMGGVHVEARKVGESRRQAHRRQRLERRRRE
jgi:hypothetical protein